MGCANQIGVSIVGLVALDVDRADVERPVIGIEHLDAEAPVVQRQISAELLFADDHAEDGPSPTVSSCLRRALTPETHKRHDDCDVDRTTIPPETTIQMPGLRVTPSLQPPICHSHRRRGSFTPYT